MIRFIKFKILLSLFWFTAKADNTTYFRFDEHKIYHEISYLTDLDEYLNVNPYLTLSVMVEKNDYQINKMNLPYHIFEVDSSKDNSSKRLLGIPGFWWGFPTSLGGSCAGGACCFYGAPILGSAGGLIGIGLVYYFTDDIKQTVNSLWGCIIGNILGSLIAFYITITYVPYIL